MTNKLCTLSTVARYRNDRIDTSRINTTNYVSTANMISSRRGIIESDRLPPTSSVSKYRTNDVLISNIRPYYKKIWLAQFDGGCSGDILVLEARKSKIHPKYLYYLLSQDHFFAHMMADAKGAKMPRGNKASILDFTFYLPPLEVQREVTGTLAPYDNLIANNTRRIKLLEESIHLLYKEWFVYLRFPNHKKSTATQGLPKGWKKSPLIDLAEITMGQSPKSKSFNTSGIGLPFHQGVKGYGFRFVRHTIYSTTSLRLANKGDILFSVRAPVGRINIAPEQISIGRGLSAIRSRSGHSSFLFYQLKSHFHTENMIGNGAIFASVTTKDLKQTQLIQPPIDLMSRFEQIAAVVDQQIWVLQKQTDRLVQSRDSLTSRLIRRTESPS